MVGQASLPVLWGFRSLLIYTITVASAQTFTHRGFLETAVWAFPQTAPNDTGRVVGSVLLRYEASYRLAPGLLLSAEFDARTDTHHMTERKLGLSWWDRNRLRPAFAVRRLGAVYTRGNLTAEFGKQYIRWGKTDVLNPTDRFAPRDFVNVVDNEFLGITAARVTYGGRTDTIDLVFEPRLTPSRVPLLNQRWAVSPPNIPVIERDPDFPSGPQFGARWNHIGRFAEYSFSFYNGYDHLPLFRAEVNPVSFRATVQRFYPRMRMYGGDVAAPLPFVTVKAEAAWFSSATPESDEYLLYVIQLERQVGEWSFIGGYAGEAITRKGTAGQFSPVRGSARAFVARAGYTLDTNRSFALETVIRQDGRGIYIKPEFTQAFGQHWRVTAGFALIRGSDGDFLGQYRRNSFALLRLRYSF